MRIDYIVYESQLHVVLFCTAERKNEINFVRLADFFDSNLQANRRSWEQKNKQNIIFL